MSHSDGNKGKSAVRLEHYEIYLDLHFYTPDQHVIMLRNFIPVFSKANFTFVLNRITYKLSLRHPR